MTGPFDKNDEGHNKVDSDTKQAAVDAKQAEADRKKKAEDDAKADVEDAKQAAGSDEEQMFARIDHIRGASVVNPHVVADALEVIYGKERPKPRPASQTARGAELDKVAAGLEVDPREPGEGDASLRKRVLEAEKEKAEADKKAEAEAKKS
jgi:ribosomal protein S25